MNLVDSSAWLEYFAGTNEGKKFRAAIESTSTLIVPTIVLFEVFKKMLLELGERAALRTTGHMMKAAVIPLDEKLSLDAAGISVKYKFAMADSIILATAQRSRATIWTQDADFKGLPGVKYFKK